MVTIKEMTQLIRVAAQCQVECLEIDGLKIQFKQGFTDINFRGVRFKQSDLPVNAPDEKAKDFEDVQEELMYLDPLGFEERLAVEGHNNAR